MGEAASADMGINQVPFDGEIAPPPPEDVIDERSFFPLYDRAEWRYRKQTSEWEMPPTVSEGAGTTVRAGAEENEFIRRTIAYAEVMVDGAARTVRQTIEETYVVEPPDRRVGPIVQIKAVTIEERNVDDDALIRRTERSYLPPYRLLSDAWRTGTFDNRLSDQVNLTEVITEPGMDEPRTVRGVVDVEVLTGIDPQVLPMEGRYREDVYQIDVSDHFGGTRSRTYWVQQGVGPVQWQFQAVNNTIFTLMETSLEQPAE